MKRVKFNEKQEEKMWKKEGNKEECVKDLHGKTAIWNVQIQQFTMIFSVFDSKELDKRTISYVCFCVKCILFYVRWMTRFVGKLSHHN